MVMGSIFMYQKPYYTTVDPVFDEFAAVSKCVLE